ncbi:MAG: histone deacetylase [Desulfobulbaceae bacterium]|nr:histone deacetylase [Desulfobulbaceae bacterium]
MKKKIGIIEDDQFYDHRVNVPVQECPERLRSIYHQIRKPEYGDLFRFYPPRLAGTKELLSIHSGLYLDQIRNHCVTSNPFSYDKDTYLMEDSFHTASLAVGGCLTLADALLADEIDSGFAFVRPPGHHAEVGRGMGFCIFNNVAAVASYLRDVHGLNRILIFDFDAHHCNGTQQIFYNDDRVLVFSIHQANLFPTCSGGVEEFGEGKGVGYNINIPVFPSYGDNEYNCLLGKVLLEVVCQYSPQIILVSAGFDGHAQDSMSDLQLSTEWFGKLTRTLKFYSSIYSTNKLLYVLEGGYHLRYLTESVMEVIKALAEPVPDEVSFPFSPRARELITSALMPTLQYKWAV